MIALSCGIKISAVRHLVLSQSTRVTDGQTDGQTDRITTPKTALAYARAVKTAIILTDVARCAVSLHQRSFLLISTVVTVIQTLLLPLHA